MSLGCSGDAQWSCRVHLHIIQCWFDGKLILRKIDQFSLYACGKWVDLPPFAKHAFHNQVGPNVQRAMLLCSPSHQGLNNCGFSQKTFFLTFYFGDFFAVLRCWPSRGEQKITSPMVLAVLAAHLVSGRHSSQEEARSAIEPTSSGPTPSESLVLDAPKILSTAKLYDHISDT